MSLRNTAGSAGFIPSSFGPGGNYSDRGAAGEQANDWDRAASRQLSRETKDDKTRIRQPEQELARKEKALAEAAALMILRKTAGAIWGRKEGEDE